MTPSELLTRVTLPVITAPMFLVSGPDLVTAACQSGVVGAFPAVNARSPEIFAEWLKHLDETLTADDAPYAVNLVLRSPMLEQHLEVCRQARTPIVITSVGNPSDVVKQVHAWGGIVLHDVVSVDHARKAAAAGVDGLILVCAGAGGHAGALSPMAFTPQVRAFYDGLIIIGGGIGDGPGILAAQALGADLAYMGTRFIATDESLAKSDYKAMMLEAQSADIVYTDSISGLPASFIRQSLTNAGLDPTSLPRRLAPMKPNLPDGLKAWKDIWSAGQGVGFIDEIRPVATVINALKADYAKARAMLGCSPT